MKISAEIRDYAAEGMEQKSRESKELGSEVYKEEEKRPEEAVPAGD